MWRCIFRKDFPRKFGFRKVERAVVFREMKRELGSAGDLRAFPDEGRRRDEDGGLHDHAGPGEIADRTGAGELGEN